MFSAQDILTVVVVVMAGNNIFPQNTLLVSGKIVLYYVLH